MIFLTACLIFFVCFVVFTLYFDDSVTLTRLTKTLLYFFGGVAFVLVTCLVYYMIDSDKLLGEEVKKELASNAWIKPELIINDKKISLDNSEFITEIDSLDWNKKSLYLTSNNNWFIVHTYFSDEAITHGELLIFEETNFQRKPFVYFDLPKEGVSNKYQAITLLNEEQVKKILNSNVRLYSKYFSAKEY